MEILVPIVSVIAVFGSIVAIVVGPSYLKSRERREIQETVRAAIDKGQPLPPEVIDALSKDIVKNLPSRSRDLRRGVLWLATGIGLGAFGLIAEMGDGGWDSRFDSGMLGIAAIPAVIGLAYIVLSFLNKNQD